MNKSKLKKITSARLFLPIVCLIAVLLLNVIRTPDFFNVSIRNGVLYGYIVDVINRASELVILAIGMTLVTAASGGQDISVGAIMAVAAAVCCQILSGGQVSVNDYQNPVILAVIAALLASALCGAFNGFLVSKLNIQPMVATLILYTAIRGNGGYFCIAAFVAEFSVAFDLLIFLYFFCFYLCDFSHFQGDL